MLKKMILIKIYFGFHPLLVIFVTTSYKYHNMPTEQYFVNKIDAIEDTGPPASSKI